MHPPKIVRPFPLALLLSLAPVAAQDEIQPVTEARLREAFAAAQAACGKVLGAKLDELPPLRLVGPAEIAEIVAAENLPLVRLRQPDEAKARAEAAAIGQGLAATVYAKYAWSTRTFLVVPKAWEGHARALGRPALTSDFALRAVMVHELCHAIDDRKFDLGKRMLGATTSDAAAAFNAVTEGHAQLVTRRVCTASGWQDGFTAFTEAIGALPATQGGGEGWKFQRRAEAAAMQTAYVDGENFATAVLAARPETGAGDMFATPPKDQETILNPRWYLDPKTRPAVLHDVEPAIDAFVAMYDDEEWSSSRSSPTGKQIATGLTMLPREDVDAIVASLRSARLVQLVPTAAPQSRAMMLCILEFDNAESASRWVRLSGVVSAHKNATMTEGALRITHAEETRLDGESLQGLLQEKTMVQGDVEFDMVTIDAHRGRLVVETILVGDPPPMAAHLKIVEDVFAAIRVAK